MSTKHDIITDNLLALTKTRTFEAAVRDWKVTKVITLTDRRGQSCELCGTRFWHGAVVRHPCHKATILVGGTCLQTLLEHRLKKRVSVNAARSFLSATLRRRYRDLVDPGSWVRWTTENAPPRLAQAVAELQAFGAVLDEKMIASLVRFHDRTRLFPKKAVLNNVERIQAVLGHALPSHLTLEMARKIAKRAERPLAAFTPEDLGAIYAKKTLRPFINKDLELKELWTELSPLEKRALAALAALDDAAAASDSPLCLPALADLWPLRVVNLCSPGMRPSASDSLG